MSEKEAEAKYNKDANDAPVVPFSEQDSNVRDFYLGLNKNWEETILSDGEIDAIDIRCGQHEVEEGKPNSPHYYEKQLLIAQAKHTGDIAYQAGVDSMLTEEGVKLAMDSMCRRERQAARMEVVKWVEKQFGYFTDEGLAKIIIDDGGYYGQPGSIKKWQEKLKEWIGRK